MKPFTVLLLPALSALAQANPLSPGPAIQARATTTAAAVPQTTPDCSGTSTAAAVSTTELAVAVAGCVGVEPTGTNDTRNDILEGICKPFTLIFARGTFEDPNLGNLVGPPFVDALDAVFGTNNVAVQGVNNYPADALDFCEGGSLTGSEDMASLIHQTRTQCPSTKLCISGYSQGCQLVHNAARLISAADTAFVNSVVLFGDPDDGLPVGSIPSYKVSTDCHAGDNICAGGDEILLPHLTYCHDVAAEAAFAKARSLAAN